ncbi:MAG: DUF1549 domain-containing protein [Planctomycetota bacterium]|nr:DUF1549 domain-containing protein [Planctomycetota bacterium]
MLIPARTFHFRLAAALIAAVAMWPQGIVRSEESVDMGGQPDQIFNFENDIIPILSRYGCNSSGCHGKAEGQNGFKLSVFGFDPEADYSALLMEGRGRRIFPAVPDQSLLLQKICGSMPHGGGIRIEPTRPEYQTIRNWIASGMRFGTQDDPKIVKIDVSPDERQLPFGMQQQLAVIATYSDGKAVDVTALAQFQSNNDGLASVDENGLVTIGQSAGTVAVMATYLGNVDTFRVLIPQPDVIESYPTLPENNFIDAHVNRRLQQLNILPSALCDDADFLRRVYLDIIGTLPTAEESRRFLSDTSNERRSTLVDQLLQRPEYADYWALKWSDVLRVNRRELGHKQAFEYYNWIRSSWAENKPLDQFARELLLAEGPVTDAPAANFYKVVNQPDKMASAVSQIFLGVRIECAQCHHHPFDRWSQTDYYGMQAFFTQVGFKTSLRGETIQATGSAKSIHPRTGQEIFAHALDQETPETSPTDDRRKLLADWMTAKDNRMFAHNLANRTWAHFMGLGLVEPVDDFRVTNPPSNPELLDALAHSFIESRFDVHQLIRTITESQTYQRTASVNQTNESDEQNYSRFLFKQLEAEVLLDAVCQTTGVEEKFRFVPKGGRAIQLWDSNAEHYFLKIFGRPVRATACECERVSEPTVSQVLHVLNSPEIQSKLSHQAGRLKLLQQAHSLDAPLVDQLYLTFFSRMPTDLEQQVALEYLESQSDRQQATEDLAWSMINSLEFLFNH